MGRFADPIPPVRTFEAALENLLEAIERAGLRAGDRLPGESDLAQQLGISSPTLRKALRVLEKTGLLQIRGGKGGGIFIASELLPLETIATHAELETAAVVETLRGRRVLETAITEAAALAATRDDLSALEWTVTLMRRNLGDRLAVRRADLMFHAAIGRAAHNRILHEAMRLLAREMVPLWDAYISADENGERILDVHRRQLREMRHLELENIRHVLDEHFRLLEEPFARSLGRSWEDVFIKPPITATETFEPPWIKLSSLPGSRGYKPHR
jgi:GntR family transcriptional regulator, transcriptional repressor for pyruvate dehydrogenase complex